MFSPIIRRILWKEFRSQRMVWLAIAAELFLLQFWWAVVGQRMVELNLFSIAFVLTGCFALTTAAMLFAAETEAGTDNWLRQLPFRPRELLVGKLGYCCMAVTTFLVFACVSTLMTASIAGTFGSWNSSVLGDPVLFAHSIAGMLAWGLFYSLTTRKVIWAVIGAALTEIIVSGTLHVVMAGFRTSDLVLYSVYWVITLLVFAVDCKLLLNWCTGELKTRSSGLTLNAEAAPIVPRVPDVPLPWLAAYRWSWIAGAATAASGLLLYGLANWDSITSLFVLGGVAICVAVGRFAFSNLNLWRVNQLPSYISIQDHPLTLRKIFALLRLAGMATIVFALSFVCCACVAYLVGPLNLLDVVVLQEIRNRLEGTELSVTLFVIGTATAIWLGEQWLRSRLELGTTGWLHLLQLSQSLPHRASRRFGPLVWIEFRRALPVLLVCWLVFVVLGFNRSLSDLMSYMAILFAALLCGLLTFLPDRTHGTLAFLTERGVSATPVLASKLIIWGGTLGLLLILPLVLQNRIWQMLESDYNLWLYTYARFEPHRYMLMQQGMMSEFPPVAHGWRIFAELLCTFTVGVLAAAWVRRPVMAVILAASMTFPVLYWLYLLRITYAPLSFTVGIPLMLVAMGIWWTCPATLLEHATWRSRCGQVAWLLLIGCFGLQAFFHFRATEIPVVELPPEIRNGGPTPLSDIKSSWPFPVPRNERETQLLAEHLDKLSEDGPERLLVQPNGPWGANNTIQSAIMSLKLNDETCDLDRSIEHLKKWYKLTQEMAWASREEDSWAECQYAHRVVLSAIRRWANHPQQTAEQLDAAYESMSAKVFYIGLPGSGPFARQWADAHLAVETGVNWETDTRPNGNRPPFLIRWLMARTGEKERVRRLIDYHALSSVNTNPFDDNSTEMTYRKWQRTTQFSAELLGVNLPGQFLDVRHPGRGELVHSTRCATYLTLLLQAWRLKHGAFPTNLRELQQDGEPVHWIMDWTSQSLFGYEPQGFERELRSSLYVTIPAKQPVIYSLGIRQPRGVMFTHAYEYSSSGELLNTRGIYQSRNMDQNQYNPTNLVPTNVSAPANPNAIRFLILGEEVDDDRVIDDVTISE